jgi:hypothetical protein
MLIQRHKKTDSRMLFILLFRQECLIYGIMPTYSRVSHTEKRYLELNSYRSFAKE